MNAAMVSICCLTYNHKKFIKTALDSFLSQKTDFRYEIIVYDDCSTDGTQDILREYAEKNPGIFRLYLSENNNYKNDSGQMFVKYLLPHAEGKYIALCEGDDYWVDIHKLQKQYDALEMNGDCSICFHDAMICDMDGNTLHQSQMSSRKHYKNRTCKYSCAEILELDFYPTASIFFRSDALKSITIPDYFYNRTCEDLPIRITLGALGNSYCINEPMSAYRIGNPNSASGRIINNGMAISKTLKGHIEILNSFDIWSKKKYHDSVCSVVRDKERKSCVITGNINGLRQVGKHTNISLKEWIKVYFIHYFPSLYWKERKQ